MISRIIFAALDRLVIRNRFNQQPLLLGIYRVQAQKIINHIMQSNGPGIFQHDNARPYTTDK